MFFIVTYSLKKPRYANFNKNGKFTGYGKLATLFSNRKDAELAYLEANLKEGYYFWEIEEMP